MKKFILYRFIVCLLCIMTAVLLPFTAFAAEQGSLNILFRHGGTTPISGASFSLYCVAEMADDGSFKFTDDFKDYSVSLDNLDSNGLNALAVTLSAYVARDSVSTDIQGKTGVYGELKFTGLKTGIYLVTGEEFTEGNTVYTPKPFIVSVPGRDTNGGLLYDVTVEPKYDSRENIDKTIERRVLKVWKDDGHKEKRPKEIKVQLLKDGEIFDETVLNSENNWRHTWSGLDADCNWQLTEKSVSDGYTVAVEQNGVTFTVTNTYDEPENPGNPSEPTTNPNEPTNPSGSDEPSNPNGTSNPINPKNPNNPNNPNQHNKSNLPHTGQLWWPVPVLICAGLVMFILGIFLKKRSEDKNA